ncbi:NADPH-dependent FMN reductase [Pseudoroseicyclus aestuarii]|uniref:Chromate reductase n=1 Tax=Pseudoroseicyclus aestuarii TaxID=1795041 RepID=A0A318SVQ8_9RHOB|nr:NAD(P)H-dependent oxidoreductase [Pseudoroseicyclus aestuarii]PYE83937.1 chromate reductase [Pseudoroseicyclus aestuarii]
MPMPTVAVLVGSLRAQSLNRRYAHALARLAEGTLEMRFCEIGDLPLYNEDLWADPPVPVLRMKQEVQAADAVMLITPEYNRGTTPAMVNALDWGSRPMGESCWPDKPAAISGISPGAPGTLGAQKELRERATVLGMQVMGLPQVYMQASEGLMQDDRIIEASAIDFLGGWLTKFAGFVEKHR